jgi:hypothetical protein
MKRMIKNSFIAAMFVAGVMFTGCKDNNNEGEVDSMTATEADTRETDVTVEPDAGIEMDTMTDTGSDTITTP